MTLRSFDLDMSACTHCPPALALVNFVVMGGGEKERERGKIRRKSYERNRRTGAVELCKAIGTHSPALPCDPKTGKRHTSSASARNMVWLWNPRRLLPPKESHTSAVETLSRRGRSCMRPAQTQAQRGQGPRDWGPMEESQSSKGRMQGPCGAPRRNHTGLPAISARLSQKQRSCNYR